MIQICVHLKQTSEEGRTVATASLTFIDGDPALGISANWEEGFRRLVEYIERGYQIVHVERMS